MSIIKHILQDNSLIIDRNPIDINVCRAIVYGLDPDVVVFVLDLLPHIPCE